MTYFEWFKNIYQCHLANKSHKCLIRVNLIMFLQGVKKSSVGFMIVLINRYWYIYIYIGCTTKFPFFNLFITEPTTKNKNITNLPTSGRYTNLSSITQTYFQCVYVPCLCRQAGLRASQSDIGGTAWVCIWQTHNLITWSHSFGVEAIPLGIFTTILIHHHH